MTEMGAQTSLPSIDCAITTKIKSDSSSFEDTEAISSIKNKNIAYFNNAGKTILPPSVERAGIRGLSYESRPWIPNDDESKTTAEVRTLFSKLIGANEDGSEIAICPSTGFALTMVAHNFLRCPSGGSDGTSVGRKGRIGHGDKILIVQDEMSSGVYCWQEICKASGASLEIVDRPTAAAAIGDDDDGNERGGIGWTESILQKIRASASEIAVVCVPQVHWSDGSLVDLKPVGDACRANNIAFVVDATQSVGILPLDVAEVRCDVLAASVHKWLLGPHGMSLVYIDPRYHDSWRPLDQHERSRRVFQNDLFDAAENLIGRNGYPEDFISGAARCDGGGKKNPIILPMVKEGLRIVTQLNLSDSQIKLRKVTDSILERAKKLGFDVQPGLRAGHIIGLRPHTPELRKKLCPATMVDIAKRLKDKNIFLAVRNGAFRVAPYLDTTSEEVDQLIVGLTEECISSIPV